MKFWKKLLAAALTGSMILGMSGMQALAAQIKIENVTLTISSDIKVGEAFGDEAIEIRGRSSKYNIVGYEVENVGFSWNETDIPKIKVTLEASNNYYFSLVASNIKLEGATYVSAVKQDSSTKLLITMTLPALDDQVGQIKNISFSGNGTVTWEPTIGAGSYEARLYRNDNGIGSTQVVTSTNASFYSIMTKSATYSVKIRGINKNDSTKKGRWQESPVVYVDDNQAESMRLKSEAPSSQWNEENGNWWYKRADGTYPMNQWEDVSGTWYYLDENGYRKTGWIKVDNKDYYLGPDGTMWASTVSPDGHTLGADGVWVQ